MMAHLYQNHLLFEPCSVKMGLNSFAKTIGSCQPAQFAQADIIRNFSMTKVNPLSHKYNF